MINQMVDKAGVARALGKSETQLDDALPALGGLGFPPSAGEHGSWHVADLLDWVTQQQEANLRFVETLVELLQAMPD